MIKALKLQIHTLNCIIMCCPKRIDNCNFFSFTFIKVIKILLLILNCIVAILYKIKYTFSTVLTKDCITKGDIPYRVLSIALFKSFRHVYSFPFLYNLREKILIMIHI